MRASVNLSSNASDDVGTSSNNTSSQEKCNFVAPSQVTITIHVIILLASLVGNTLLITAFARMKEPIMLLIANMAASDLLVAIFLIPRLITRDVIGSNAFLVHGNGGQFLCKMCTFLGDISLSVSTQSLVLIAVERFLAVVYPIEYKKITVKVRRFLVASTWIMAMAFHSPYFYTMRLVANANHQECQPSWEPAFDNMSARLRYNIFLFIVVLLVPLLVISVLYTVIVIKLQKDKMASYRSERGARRNQERNKNLQRMAAATVTAFLISWTLYSVIHFLKLFSPETIPKCKDSFKIVDEISRVLAISYCAVNPCICFIFVRNFSRELSIMCQRKGQLSTMVDRKVTGQSGVSNDCRIELRQSCSESTQTMTLLRNMNDHCSSIVSTPSGSLQQIGLYVSI